MHAVEEKDAFAQFVEHIKQCGTIGPATRAGVFQSFQHALFVAVGLQASDEPRAAVGQRFVIEIRRVLRGDEKSETEGACLFEQEKQRAFRRRVGDGRQVAENFVEIEEGAQRGRARLTTHPRDHFLEQGGDKEHAFRVGQMGNAQHGEARLSFRRVQKLGDVERFALAPSGEAGRGEKIVEGKDEFHALLGRIKIVERKHPDLVEGRLLHRGDQAGQVGRLPARPRVLQDGREQAEFAALQRVRVESEQSE